MSKPLALHLAPPNDGSRSYAIIFDQGKTIREGVANLSSVRIEN